MGKLASDGPFPRGREHVLEPVRRVFIEAFERVDVAVQREAGRVVSETSLGRLQTDAGELSGPIRR